MQDDLQNVSVKGAVQSVGEYYSVYAINVL